MVYVLGAGGGTELVLHSFSDMPDGAYPFSGGLLLEGNKVYGATSVGGANGTGTIFQLTSAGGHWKYKVLGSFGSGIAGEPGYGE